MLKVQGGKLRQDGHTVYNSTGQDDRQLMENVVKFSEQASTIAAAMGDTRIAVL